MGVGGVAPEEDSLVERVPGCNPLADFCAADMSEDFDDLDIAESVRYTLNQSTRPNSSLKGSKILRAASRQMS